MNNQKFYVVWKGKNPGVYDNWKDCNEQVKGYVMPMFKAFTDKEKAIQAFREPAYKHIGKKQSVSFINDSTVYQEPNQNSIIVASKVKKHLGITEYIGLDYFTCKVLFKRNCNTIHSNVGTYLGCAYAIWYSRTKGLFVPVYTTSSTAYYWVHKGGLDDEMLARLDDDLKSIIKKATDLLIWSKISSKVEKWHEHAWGSNPAFDYLN
jgi:ribonuclease HI